MKNLLLSLLLISMTAKGFAQYTPPEISNPFYNSIIIPEIDVDYLEEVQGKSTPNQVKLIEQQVSNWDPTQSPNFYKAKDEFFSATFYTDKGYVAAYYNDDGDIEYAEERFRNVSLPSLVSKRVAREYPGWILESNKYILQYTAGKKTRRLYKVKITRGNKSKRYKIHVPESK